MNGYEALVQPALFVLLALATLRTLLKGASREVTGTRKVSGQEFETRKIRLRSGALLRSGVTLIVGLLALSAVVVTPPGHRGVIYSSVGGVHQTERVEGVSFIVPVLQTATQYSVRTQRYTNTEVYSQSSDLQEITVELSVNYHVDPTEAAKVHETLGKNYEKTVIEPAVLQLTKEAVGTVKAVDFAQNRNALAGSVLEKMQARMSEYGIVIESVNIEDAVFDADFILSVKNKVIADEVAEQQQRLIAAEEAKKRQIEVQADAEAYRLETTAQGQAEANRLIDESLTADLIIWQRILKWNGTLPTTLLDGDGEGDFIYELP